MLSPNAEATPPRAQPHFLANKHASLPPHSTNPPTEQPPASLPSPLPIIGCSSSDMSSLKPTVAGCWLAAQPVRPPSLTNGNPGHSGKGGVHSSRKQWLGEGCEFMLHILWIGAHGREGEAVPAHPLQLVNAPLLLRFSRCRASHTVTHCLIYLIRYITRPLHQKISFYSVRSFFSPLPLWVEQTSMSPFEKANSSLATYKEHGWISSCVWGTCIGKSKPTITKHWACP